jgi:regulator of sirC expression with transglutaminase-like and TPR domain
MANELKQRLSKALFNFYISQAERIPEIRIIEELRTLLFEEMRFTGNQQDYYNPSNR